MPRPTRWTESELRDAVSMSRTLGEVARRLDLSVGGGTYASLRRHIARLGLDAGHIAAPVSGRPAPRRSWTDDDLAQVVATSMTMAEVHRRLGYRPSGGTHRLLIAHIRRLGLDTAHFRGQAWSRGVATGRGFAAMPLDDILVQNSTYSNSARPRRRLIAAGLKQPRCETCGLDTWCGKPMALQLDHRNGDPTDNRLGNLRILCPNCHAQTATWCGGNRSRRTPTG